MALFSWFKNAQNNDVSKIKNIYSNNENNNLNQNTMWPIAKVRNNSISLPVIYVKTSSYLTKPTLINKLNEQNS